MDFLKKFIKHKTTIQDVISSLENFDNDVKSLNNFKEKATEYFGINWKFNLEVYISSLPKCSIYQMVDLILYAQNVLFDQMQEMILFILQKCLQMF